MREFFKGWRRKIGIFLLVIAVVLLVAWVRSYGLRDFYGFPKSSPEVRYVLESSLGRLILRRYEQKFDPFGEFFTGYSWYSRSHLESEKTFPDRDIGETYETVWERQVYGFHMGSAEQFYIASPFAGDGTIVITNQMSYWSVPFWWLVLPLTLTSGWLIIWKRRKRAVETPQPESGQKSNSDAR